MCFSMQSRLICCEICVHVMRARVFADGAQANTMAEQADLEAQRAEVEAALHRARRAVEEAQST
eukprot:COSAG02_NODE_1286_length_13453_cov_2.682342_4_plen_64_part_00